MSDADVIRKAIDKVVKAIEVEGPAPWYHRRVMAKQRQEWPTLWRALDQLRVLYRLENES